MALDSLGLSMSTPVPWVGPKPIRLRIMDEIGLRLKRITIAQGYLSNAGALVWYGRLVDPEPTQVPMLNFWDGHEDGERKPYGVHTKHVAVTVEMYDKFDADDKGLSLPVVSNQMLADCERAMMYDLGGEYDPTMGGLAEAVSYTASDIIFGVRPELWVGALVQWTVTYSNPLGQPTKLVS